MSEIESWVDRNCPNDAEWFIQKYALDTKSRKREKVFLRMELCRILRNHSTMTFAQIGKLINRDHSNVVYLKDIATYYHRHNDKLYLDIIEEYADDFKLVITELKKQS